MEVEYDEEVEGVFDDESDDDDEDYIPEKGSYHSDSDSDRKRKGRAPKSKRAKVVRSGRGRGRGASVSNRSGSVSPSKKTASKVSPGKRKTPSRSTRKSSSKTSDDDSTVVSPLRRSSRSSSKRSISYADADVSDEDIDEDELIVKTAKQRESRKKHVDDLWQSFKNDTSNKKPNTKKPVQSEIQKQDEVKDTNSKENENTIEVDKPESNEASKTDSENTQICIKEKDSLSLLNKGNVDTTTENISSSDNAHSCSSSKEKLSIVDDNSCAEKDTPKKNNEENKNIIERDKTSTKKDKAVNEKEKPVADVEEIVIEKDKLENKANTCVDKDECNKDSNENETKDKNSDSPVFNKKSSSLSGDTLKKVEVTETFDFAGEEVKVKKLVDVKELEDKEKAAKEEAEKESNEKPTSSNLSKVASGLKRSGGGLASVIGSLEKKKKMSVLDKSKLDWNSYKDDEGLEDELKANRNSGYLDKQDFLQRVDYKQWENEREMRLYSNRK